MGCCRARSLGESDDFSGGVLSYGGGLGFGDQFIDCRSMTTSVVIQSPEICIRVSEMPWFVDPDEVDGGLRHADRDTIRWGTVGEIIQELGGMLDRREFQAREYEDGVYFVLVVANRFELSQAERNIVNSWFTNAEAPQGDPWRDDLVNGRHRLSGVWKADPEASLPILSDHLMYEDSIEAMGEEFEQGFYLSSKIGMLKITEDSPVRARSTAYFERLEHNARQAPTIPDAELQIELELIEGGYLDVGPIEHETEAPADRKTGFFQRLFGRG